MPAFLEGGGGITRLVLGAGVFGGLQDEAAERALAAPVRARQMAVWRRFKPWG